jgi:hypothetical protein
VLLVEDDDLCATRRLLAAGVRRRLSVGRATPRAHAGFVITDLNLGGMNGIDHHV